MPVERKKIVFIVNPNASTGAVGKEWPRIRDRANNRLGETEALFTEERDHATALTRSALMGGADLIVCVGGDGTLNEVVNGFMEEDGPVRPDSLLGFIPYGTGCDFMKTMAIPKEANEALDVIKASHVRTIDVGHLKYTGHDDLPVTRFFHNVTSFGLGGEVDERVNRTTKALGGFVSFIMGTLISVVRYDRKKVRIKVDEHFDEVVSSWNVAVANGQYHGGGMWVAPEAVVDDGLFHVTIIGDLTLPQVFWHLPKLYRGTHMGLEKVTATTGKRIQAFSDQRVLLDVDGEQPGKLPVTIDIIPGAIKFICPP